MSARAVPATRISPPSVVRAAGERARAIHPELMDVKAEHNASCRAPSNRASGRAASWLEACARAARARSAKEALEAVLLSAIEATRSERAFLVTSAQDASAARTATIESAVSVRPDRSRVPSSTLLRHALSRGRPFACTDLGQDGDLRAEGSVRSLELRSVLSVPVPVPPPLRAALVLDSRLPRPFEPEDALLAAEEHAGLVALLASLGRDRPGGARATEAQGTAELVGRSRSFLDLLAQADRVAATRLPVLLVGESGTGKELLARRIHEASPRRDAPFVAVNCAALPDSLLESEMFGAARGAYTGADRDRPGLFQLAHGGTLLLDEIGEMPSCLQAKLLRVLQDGRVRPLGARAETVVDVRVLAATHRDLPGLVAAGRFRGDLYYRLAVVELRVPALRERLEDLPAIAEHLLARLARAHGLPCGRLSPGAIAHLVSRPWPGNVRQLEAVLARALLRTGSGEIGASDLEPHPPPSPECGPPVTLERAMIEAALAEAGGVVSRAAARIGWSRQKLQRRMAALGIQRPPSRPGARSSDSSTFQ